MNNNDEQQQNFRFTRKLKVFDAWTLSFGGIIGFGSFLMPGTTFLKNAGILGTLIAMEIGLFTMLIISYAYGYMAKKFSLSGGQFLYAEKAFGRKHGFICAWFLGLCYLSIIPMDAMALSLFFRSIYGNTFQVVFLYNISGDDVYLGEFLVATASLILFAYVLSKGVRIGAIIQNVMVIILIAGVLLILLGAFACDAVKLSNFNPLFYPDDRSFFLQ
ncbi:MAG: APC family permease, partial [Synergistaceae bacterium]|nr:APC family permease [Synergistaceae bacterium]